jgi:hypothetical protein
MDIRGCTGLMVLLALAVAPACRRPNPAGERPEQDEREKQVAAFAAKRAAHAKELAAMEVPRLAADLREESLRGLEPFNSMAYQEMVARGPKAAAALRAELHEPARASFLGLLALRAMDSTQYAGLPPTFRVDVLLDALRTSRLFNAWGMPHTGWEDAARAIIAEGRVAEPGLTRLLDDRRRAPMWGSEDAAESERYGYRVRDYAWALLRAIHGETGPIPVDSAGRDSLIGAGPTQRK